MTAELYEALASAQAEMANPKFDAQNPHFKNRYASLAAVRDAVVPVLARHGIAVIQSAQTVENGVQVTTTLLHKGGGRLDIGPLWMPVGKGDAQGYGSALTYARRYALMSALSVVGDADDDAEGAVIRNITPLNADERAKWEAKATEGVEALRSAFNALDDAQKARVQADAAWWANVKRASAKVAA